MSSEQREPSPLTEGISEDASRNTLALNPLVGIRGQDLADSANILFKAVVNEPKVATEQWLSLLGEIGSIVAGKSERAPKSGDRRFSDATWKESALHSGLLKAYLAWGDAAAYLLQPVADGIVMVDPARNALDILDKQVGFRRMQGAARWRSLLRESAAFRNSLPTLHAEG